MNILFINPPHPSMGKQTNEGAGHAALERRFHGMMELDHFLPTYHFNEVHSIEVQASASRIFRAIQEVTPSELSPVFRLLFWIRSLPARLAGKSAMGFAPAQPLLDQLEGNFIFLANIPDREIVFGMIGQFWKPAGNQAVPLAHVQEFIQFDRPGYAKVAANFYISEGRRDGRLTVSTESRVCVADSEARKKFACYWFVIYLGSSYIRRLLLKAIRRRAEQT